MRLTYALRIVNVLGLAWMGLAGGPKSLAAAPDATQNDLLSHTLQAQDAGAAWTELQESAHRPPQPAAWKTAPPTEEQQKQFLVPYVLALEDRAKVFYTRFPADAHAVDAQLQEMEFISVAMQLGGASQQARLEDLEKSLIGNPHLTEKQRFSVRRNQVLRSGQVTASRGEGASLAAFESGIRDLQKEFPNEPDIESMLFEIASLCDGAKARALVLEISNSGATEDVKAAAADLLKKLAPVGKPVTLEFAAVDGRAVDLAKLKGKVVLLDFWATWCPPCVREVPEVVASYGKLHPKGLEIVGISLDESKDSLTKFVAEKAMPWPQFFDGQKWQNKYARQFGIESVPSMWLIDKQGNLRDINAQFDLDGKVEKLLAE